MVTTQKIGKSLIKHEYENYSIRISPEQRKYIKSQASKRGLKLRDFIFKACRYYCKNSGE